MFYANIMNNCPNFVMIQNECNMRKLFSLLAILWCCSALAQSSPSRVVEGSVYSQILQCSRSYNIYLPGGYDEDTEKSYPILYLLHGAGDDHTTWENRAHVRDVMNNLVRSGQVEEMIIVMPMAGIAKGETKSYLGYFNFPEWKYEDFFFQEFIPEIEKRYRVKADKHSRAIAGLSMGGGGCTSYAQKHPEMFCVSYAMSALMDNPASRILDPNDNSMWTLMRKSAVENSCVAFVRDASDQTLEQLKTVKWFVDCGDEDFLLEVNLDFARVMKDRAVPFELRIRDGVHDWEYWHSALYISLPYLSRNFGN